MGIDINHTRLVIDELTKNINDPLYSSKSSIYYFDRAMLYFVLGEYEPALEDISISLSLSPNDPLIHAHKGIILHAFGRSEEAMNEYDRALEIDPASKYVKENRTLLLSQISNRDELFALSKLIKVNPNDFALYYKRGCIYDDLFDYERAKEDLTTCINLRPTYSPAYNARGVVYSKMKKYREALKDFDTAIILDNHYEDAYTNKIHLYKSLYDDKKRLEAINKLIEKNPTTATGYYEKGLYYKELKDITEAILWFQKAIDVEIDFSKAIKELKELNELIIHKESMDE